MAQYSATTSHNSSYTLRLTVEETNVNNTNNTSDVSWALDFLTTGAGYSGIVNSISCTINDQTVFSESNKTHNYTTHNKTYSIASGTVTGITHDNDGSKTINVGATFRSPSSASYYPGNATISDTFALTNIPRVSVLNSFTITIANDGNSATVTPSITKQNSNYYDVLKLSSGATPIAMIGGVTNNVSKNLSQNAINTLYQIIGTSTGANVIGWISTYTSQGGTAIGDSAMKGYFVSLPSYSLSNTITATDNITTYNTYKNNASDLIANLSQPNLVFSATSSTGSTYGRPITYTINNEASTSPKTINNYMGGNFTLVSTDGRKTATVTTSNTVIPYQRPTISCQIVRTTATGSTASVTITGKYYDGDGFNASALLTRSIVLKYTETGGTEQTLSNFTINETTTNNIVSYTATATLSNLNYKKGISYTAIISDLIGVTNDANGSLPQGLPVWNTYKDSSNNQYFNINGGLSINENAAIYGSDGKTINKNLIVDGSNATLESIANLANNNGTTIYTGNITSTGTYNFSSSAANYRFLIIELTTGTATVRTYCIVPGVKIYDGYSQYISGIVEGNITLYIRAVISAASFQIAAIGSTTHVRSIKGII